MNFHINKLSKKISRNIGIFKELHFIVSVQHNNLLTIYKTLILPRINYCFLSLGSKLEKNFQLQKNVLFKQSQVQILSLMQNRFSSSMLL